jgi:D-glycero-D-manno-heptose 1,7-bisphosphate phosphatase
MSRTLRPAVFLDRDGVLNRSLVREGKPFSPRRLDEFRLVPGAAASVRALKEAGYVVVVVTNQPDIGNGHVTAELMAVIHARLAGRVPVDDIMCCPHRREDGCDCRKPKPGMLLAAAERHGIDLERSILVGDRSGDIAAGVAAGCYTILINRRYREPANAQPHASVRSLASAVRHILARQGQGPHR